MSSSVSSTSSQPLPGHAVYRPDIDGIRALAVLSVVAFHAFPDLIRGGFIGVDIFFVISGFLISGILFNDLAQGRFSITDFYVRRIKRIFPALILVLLACFVFGWFALLADEFKQLGKHMAGGAGFVSNIVLWSEAGYFDTSAETKPLLHLWSLGVEEQFYFIWPLLLWLTWKLRISQLWMLVAIALVSFVINVATVHTHSVAAFYLPFSRFWELLCGALLAYLTFHQSTRLQRFRQSPLANLGSIIGFLLIVVAICIVTKEDAFPGWWALLPELGAILMLAAGPTAVFNRRILSSRVLVWFGLISYPLYLWHWPLLAFARVVAGQTPPPAIRIAAVLISIVLAWLTWRLVERPIRFGGKGRRSALVLSVIMLFVGYLGYYTYQRNGMEFRDMGRVAMLFNPDVAQVSVLNSFELPRPSCAALTGVKHERDWCTAPVAPVMDPALLLIGDSFSGAYAPMFAKLHQMHPGAEYAFRQFARGACPSLLEYGGPYCREISSKIAAYVERTPSIKTVALAANWPGYYVADSAVFEQALERTVAFYRKLGKRVVVLLSPPNGANPKACIMRAIRFSDADFCNLPLERADKFDDHYRDHLLPQLQHLDVPTFDPFPYLCGKGGCKVIDGPRILYFDAGHLSVYGAEFVADHADRELSDLLLGTK